MIYFSNMLRYFKDEEKSVRRGENHYNSGHILACTVSQGQLIGSVRASMKKKTYKVVVSSDFEINLYFLHKSKWLKQLIVGIMNEWMN